MLADVTGLQIRAEHGYGPETGGLDSVKLSSRSAPSDVFGEDRHAIAGDLAASSHHLADAAHFLLA